MATLKVARELVDIFYPVGSYYETSNASFNPNTSWGGTWVEDTKGQTLVAKTDNGTFSTLGANVGEETHTHEYGLIYCGAYRDTVIERNANAGIMNFNSDGTFTLNNGSSAMVGQYETEVNGGYQGSTITSPTALSHYMATGNTSYENNIQPSKVVIRWHRTA